MLIWVVLVLYPLILIAFLPRRKLRKTIRSWYDFVVVSAHRQKLIAEFKERRRIKSLNKTEEVSRLILAIKSDSYSNGQHVKTLLEEWKHDPELTNLGMELTQLVREVKQVSRSMFQPSGRGVSR